MEEETQTKSLDVEGVVKDILGTIEREREREIISRRFGLFDRRETLEQIGELLGITRERVRQLEKAVVAKLKASAAKGDVPDLEKLQQQVAAELKAMGGVARISELSARLNKESTKLDQARIAFLAELC